MRNKPGIKAAAMVILAAVFCGMGPAEAVAESLGAWNGLDQLALVDSPYVSSSLKKRINKLPDEAQENLPVPVLFGVEPGDLTENFGDARSGGRTHEGLDIIAPKGAPIISPTKAVVLSVGTGPSSGNTVSTANPGGETFVYMHLDSVASIDKGDTLKPGDLIGFCGNTGNASGGAAHLHFEIRKKNATDPYPRLTDEFSLEDKIEFSKKMIENSDDPDALAEFLADNYPDQFALAMAEDIDISAEVTDILDLSATGTAGQKTTVLSVGASGSAVKTLQSYLITQNKGPAAGALAAKGATGYFGPLTQTALIEYQNSAGLAATGSYAVPKGDNFFANLEGQKTKKTDNSKTADIERLKAQIAAIQAEILILQQQLALMTGSV